MKHLFVLAALVASVFIISVTAYAQDYTVPGGTPQSDTITGTAQAERLDGGGGKDILDEIGRAHV